MNDKLTFNDVFKGKYAEMIHSYLLQSLGESSDRTEPLNEILVTIDNMLNNGSIEIKKGLVVLLATEVLQGFELIWGADGKA